jgi:hypothetical protein
MTTSATKESNIQLGKLKTILNDTSIRTIKEAESKINLNSIPEDSVSRWLNNSKSNASQNTKMFGGNLTETKHNSGPSPR